METSEKKSFAWLNSVLRILVFALEAFASWGSSRFWHDDPFITFRVARNFAEGHGLVYNLGQHYQATSAPGYAILLGGLAWLTGRVESIPTLAMVLSGLALTAMALGLLEHGIRHQQTAIGFLAALFATTIASSTDAVGNEILPQVALVVWGFYTEIGLIGWYAPNVSILDPLGLGSAVNLDHIRKAQTLLNLVDHPPELMLTQVELTGELTLKLDWVERPSMRAYHEFLPRWFSETYRPGREIASPYPKESVTIWIRKDVDPNLFRLDP